jgi:hypothetical protein
VVSYTQTRTLPSGSRYVFQGLKVHVRHQAVFGQLQPLDQTRIPSAMQQRKRTSMAIAEGMRIKARRHNPDAGQINSSTYLYPEIAFSVKV